MKKILYFVLAAVAITSCNNSKRTSQESQGSQESAEPVETYFTAIDKYLAEQIGSQYAPGTICIPFHNYIAVDESNSDDILVWGDYWLFNYVQSGDTLKTVSGGNHPGLMHVKQTGDTQFEVLSFDQVEDGAGNEASAKKIFGEKYTDFCAAHADETKRESIRTEVISDYVVRHDIPVSMYKDYGWPEVVIPTK